MISIKIRQSRWRSSLLPPTHPTKGSRNRRFIEDYDISSKGVDGILEFILSLHRSGARVSTLASTSKKIVSAISRAEKLCSDALSTSPLQLAVAAFSTSALAAVPTDPASRSADVPMAEPTSRPAQPSPFPRPPRLERSYPSDGIYGRGPWWITPAPVPSGMVTGPEARSAMTCRQKQWRLLARRHGHQAHAGEGGPRLPGNSE